MTIQPTSFKIVSGGQTGADQAGLRAARAAGIETGGWAPKGWDTEDGPAPWLEDFGLIECPVTGYPARTEANGLKPFGTELIVFLLKHIAPSPFSRTISSPHRRIPSRARPPRMPRLEGSVGWRWQGGIRL
jgi:Circularly permutated YpsA SLOG family